MVANAGSTSYISMVSAVPSFNLTDNVTDSVGSVSEVARIEEEASMWLWRVVSPILFLGGVGGNILVVLTFAKLHVSESSTLVHLMVLAVTDTVVLATGLSRYWTLNAFDFDVRTISNFGCKLHLFVIYVSMDFSSWILVSVTFERLISVYWPLHVRRWCTVPRGIIRLAAIFIFLVVLNGHYFWTNTIINEKCTSINPKVRHFEEFIFVWIDMVFVCLAPFVLMLVCDCFIIAALRQARTVQKSTIANMEQMKNGGRSGQTFHVSTTTRMLLSVTCFFFVTTLPVAVYFIVDSFLRPKASPEQHARLDLAWTVTYLLQYLNYSCNFLLYAARNRRFLRQLLHILHIRKLRRGSTWMSSTMGPDNNPDDAATRRHSQLRRSRASVLSGGSVASGLSRAASTVLTLADLSPGSTANWTHRRGDSLISQASSMSAGISGGPSSMLTLQDLSPSKARSRFSPGPGHGEGRARRGDGERAAESDGEEEWRERPHNGVWRRGSAPALSLARFVRDALRASRAQKDDLTTENGDSCDVSDEVKLVKRNSMDKEKDSLDSEGDGKHKYSENEDEQRDRTKETDCKVHCNGNLITDTPSMQHVNRILSNDDSICVNPNDVVYDLLHCIDANDKKNGDNSIAPLQPNNEVGSNNDNDNDEMNTDDNKRDQAQKHSAVASRSATETCSDRDTSKCAEVGAVEPLGTEREGDDNASNVKHATHPHASSKPDGSSVDSNGSHDDRGGGASESHDANEYQLIITGTSRPRNFGFTSLTIQTLVGEDNVETYL